MTSRRARIAAALMAAGAGLSLGGPVLVAPAAHAAVVPCIDAAADTSRQDGANLLRRPVDHPQVGAKDLAAIEEVVTGANTRLRARTARPRLASTITIPVRIHVVRGKHRGERGFASKRRIARTMEILNNAYAGKQSSLSHRVRFRFDLVSVDRRKRDGWYHAWSNGPRTKKMMRALHRGNRRTLNLYINGAGSASMPVLGFARFPWQQARSPKLDGVIVNHRALPWGRFTNYNRGDTVVHEVGHWLGLFHTFQGGCEGGGDLVRDTPAEAGPADGCPVGRDTCLDDPGRDHVRNFMNYSYDSCMREFTAGQALRMDIAWAKWRQ